MDGKLPQASPSIAIQLALCHTGKRYCCLDHHRKKSASWQLGLSREDTKNAKARR